MRRQGIAIAAAAALAAAAVPLAWSGGAGMGTAAAHAEECGCGGGHHGRGGRGRGSAGGAAGGPPGYSGEQHVGGVHPGADQVPGGITDHDVEASLGEEGHTESGGSGGHGGHMGGPGSGRMGGRSGGGSDQRPSAEERASAHAKVEGRGHAGRQTPGEPSRGGMGGRRGEADIWGPGASHATLPHLEIGRLNVAHAPSKVFDRAVTEALAGLDPQARALYALPFDQALAGIARLPEEARVEGPLQNLALYRALMAGRSLPLQIADRLDAAAIFLGSAAGGEAVVNRDTVLTVNALLGLGKMGGATADRLAAQAEQVREALSAGHDEHIEGTEGGHEGGAGGHTP